MVERPKRRLVVAALLAAFLAGCGGDTPAPPVAVGPSAVANMVGQWHLDSYGGQPLPAGVTVTYRPEGEVEVDGGPPTIDRARLKRAMDEFGRGWGAGTPTTAGGRETTSSPGQPPVLFEYKLRRK